MGQLVSRKLFFILNKVTGIFANLTQRFYISLKGYLVYVQWLALGQMDIRDLSNLSLCSFPFFKSFNLWFFHILI